MQLSQVVLLAAVHTLLRLGASLAQNVTALRLLLCVVVTATAGSLTGPACKQR
jgi:hypothetical protein